MLRYTSDIPLISGGGHCCEKYKAGVVAALVARSCPAGDRPDAEKGCTATTRLQKKAAPPPPIVYL